VSVQQVRWVIDHGPQQRTERLLLMVIAEHANEQTGRCDPSIDLLADECRMKPRSVYRVLRRLEQGGWLVTVSGGGRHNTNQYVVNTTKETLTGGSLNPDRPAQETLTVETQTLTGGSLNPDRGVSRTRRTRSNQKGEPERTDERPRLRGRGATPRTLHAKFNEGD